MKFSVSSSDLLKKLSLGSGAISSNPVMPILEDFLFSIKENKLTITSTNLETTILTNIEVTSEKNGEIAIPAQILVDTLKALPDQPITFVVDEDNNGIRITSAYGEYKLAGDMSADFPHTPADDEVQSVTIDANVFQKAISKTLFATSNDELRLAMMGVYVNVDFSNITFVATDAHKLVKYTFGDIKSDVTASFIIPKKGLNLIKNALKGDEEVTLSFNKTNVFLEFGDTKIIIRLIDAKFPDYNAVIPSKNPYLLTLDRKDFQNSLKRIAIYANKTTNQVVLNLSDTSLTLSAQDLDFSNEANEQLSCTYDGEAMNIGFNAKFLIEMLGVLESDEVKLELSEPNKAGVLVPSENAGKEELLMLVMPVMMSN